MSLPFVPSAELDRGCCFDLDLSRPGDITNNRGVVSGALQWDAVRGARFDGTNDYITFGSSVQPFNSGFWSAAITFWPEFDISADGTQILLYDEVPNTRIYRYKSGATHNLYVRAGSAVQILISDYAVWGNLWRHNQRNVLVATARSGGNAMYLNGALIATSVSAWTPINLTNMYIGATNTGTYKFLGSITSVKFFRHNSAAELLTAQEASDYFNNKAFNYAQRASCILPMQAAQHEPSHATQVTDIDQSAKIADGDMEAVDMAAWTTVGAGATFQKVAGARTGGTGTKVLQIIRSGASSYCYQNVLTSGVRYRVTGWARGDGVASWPRMGTDAAMQWSGTTSATWQYFDVTFTSTSIWFVLYNQTDNGTVEFDDVTVQYATSILSDGDAESSNTDPWSIGNAAALTKSLVTPYSGTACLRVAYGGIANPSAYQVVCTVGKRYRISGAARGNGVFYPYVADTTGAAMWIGTTSTTWQTFSVDVTMTQTQVKLFSNANAAGYCEFDNMSVVEMRARTLDASGRGNNLLTGDGVTPTTFPAKLSQRGYSFDGTSDYMKRAGLGLTDFTVMTVAKKDTGVAGCLWAAQRTGGTGTGLGAYITTDLTVITVLYNDGTGTITTTAPFPRSAINCHAFVYTAATRVMQIYYNGALVYTTVALTVPNGYNGDFWLGVRCSDAVWYWPGSIYGATVLPFCCTPLQVADHYRQTLQQINAV